MYNRILLPTDGSDNSKKAIEYAKEIAKSFSSEIVLLYIYEVTDKITELVSKVDKGIKEQLEDMENHIHQYAGGVLDEISKDLESSGIKVKKIQDKGKSGPEIIKIIDSEKCDLVVMGSRGLGSIKSALIGSTSNYVVHHTKCPTLVVH